MTRDQAWDILCEFTKSESLRRHALAVETCVTAYARKYGEDTERWGLTGLIHDFDWERHPTPALHPMRGVEHLRVMDCSVLPVMVAGNLNGPMMAMASRAADLILADR